MTVQIKQLYINCIWTSWWDIKEEKRSFVVQSWFWKDIRLNRLGDGENGVQCQMEKLDIGMPSIKSHAISSEW